eukprot:9171608-Prorocentrum_lima.AAC.1
MAYFPDRTLETAKCLVADCVPGASVVAVLQCHPHTRPDWPHARDLPLSYDMWRQGDLEFPTEAW